jgi:hypothetical protein
MTARADAGQPDKENGSMDISREDAAEVLTERRALAVLRPTPLGSLCMG